MHTHTYTHTEGKYYPEYKTTRRQHCCIENHPNNITKYTIQKVNIYNTERGKDKTTPTSPPPSLLPTPNFLV